MIVLVDMNESELIAYTHLRQDGFCGTRGLEGLRLRI